MWQIPGLLPFSGSFIIMSLFWSSMFSHFSRRISPIRMAVSLAIWSMTLSFRPVPLMTWSSSCSVGMNGILS